MPAGAPGPRACGHYESHESYESYLRDYERRHFGERYSERGPAGPKGERHEGSHENDQE